MTTKVCPICNKPKDTLRSAVKDGVYLSDRCDACLAGFGGFADKARAFERDWQRREFARDLIQPWEKEFAKEFPNQARQKGWDEESMRKYG